jgi:hypothetical protein
MAVMLAGYAPAEDRDKALAKVDAAMELRHAQLLALDRELESLADPGLAAAQSILLIADWGGRAKDAQPAVTALQTIAEEAQGTPVGRLALREAGKLLASRNRYPEGVRALTRLALEAVKQTRPLIRRGEPEADEGRLKQWDAQLQAKEAALTARSQQLEEEAERLKEYALALKAEEAKLQAAQSTAAAGNTGTASPSQPEKPPAETRPSTRSGRAEPAKAR